MARAARAPVARGPWQELISTPRWSISLCGFLYYLGSIITLRVPGADIAIVVSLLALFIEGQPIRIGRALTAGLVWVGWLWLCTVLSPDPVTSYETSWQMTKVWLVTFVAFNVLRTRESIRLALAFTVFCFLIYPVRGAILNYLGGYTLRGRAIWNLTYSNPNDLAGFALLWGSSSLALGILTRVRLVRIGAIAAAGVMLVLILLTQSRGTFLGASAVIAIGLLPRLKNVRIVLTATALIGVAVFFAPSSVWERIGGLGSASFESGMSGVDSEGSAEQRWQIAQVAWHLASENALFGIGPGRYSVAHAQMASQLSGELPLAGGNRDAHNTYLSTAAQSGFPGLIIFLVVVAQGFRAFRARHRKDSNPAGRAAYVLALGVLGLMIAGFFSTNQYLNSLHLHLVTIEALLLASATPGRLSSSGQSAQPGLRRRRPPLRLAAPAAASSF